MTTGSRQSGSFYNSGEVVWNPTKVALSLHMHAVKQTAERKGGTRAGDGCGEMTWID